MAKLSSLKARNDENGKQIKCLIVEDYNSGNLLKYYNPQDFNNVINSTDSMFLTKVYFPTEEQKRGLFATIESGIVDKNGKQSIEINDMDMVINMISKFTDLEFDVNDTVEINEIISNPNILYLAIKTEMDSILMSIIEHYICTVKTLQSNPQTTTMLASQLNIESEIVNKVDIEKEKKRQELLAQLKELE